MRVTVIVPKSGALRSGATSVTPTSANRSAKYCAFVDRADEAKPWR